MRREMRVYLALLAACLIVAACGKKIEPPKPVTEMSLAILQNDGEIFQPRLDDIEFNLHISETQRRALAKSELTVEILDKTSTPPLEQIGTLSFTMDGKAISEYGSFRESCYLPGDPAAIGTCRIRSIILNKSIIDPLGNKSQIFKHTSDNYSPDHTGISYCELNFDSSNIDWSDGEYADGSNQRYKFAFLDSQMKQTNRPSIQYSLTLTCYKKQGSRGKKEHHSVFRGVFKQKTSS